MRRSRETRDTEVQDKEPQRYRRGRKKRGRDTKVQINGATMVQKANRTRREEKRTGTEHDQGSGEVVEKKKKSRGLEGRG